jgi:hypothetical protein
MSKSTIWRGLLPVFLLAGIAQAADSEFTGSLNRLRSDSLMLKMTDGRLIDAVLPQTDELSVRAIAGQYALADQVEIVCKSIKSFYDTRAFLHQHLELKSIRRVRAATPEELSDAMDALSWQIGENYLRHPGVPNPGEDHDLARVRRANLEYESKLPDFVADETARRYISEPVGKPWRLDDTIESEISYKGGRFTRSNVRRDGNPWRRPFVDLGGMVWGVTFGLELKSVFDPQCPTKVNFYGTEQVDAKPLLVYTFYSNRNGCFGNYASGDLKQTYNPDRTGRMLVEPTHGDVVRYEEEASGLPETYVMDRHTITESWDYVTIGGVSYLVPVSAEHIARHSDGAQRRVSVTYTNHRHFEARTKVTFDR